MEETYADRVLNVTVTGGVVRIDLASLAPHRDKDDKPQLEFRRRVVMPVDGFLQSFSMMAQVVQQLEKQGVIKRAPDASGTGAQPGPSVRL